MHLPRPHLLVALLLAVIPLHAADDYAIDWYQIGSGASTTSSGEDYALAGTIGQAAAGGPMSGDVFALTGGFSAVHALQTEGAPELAIYLTETTAAVVTWPAPSTGWELRQNVDPASAAWTVPAEPVQDDGKVRFIVVAQPQGVRYFRLEPVAALLASPLSPVPDTVVTNVDLVAVSFSAGVTAESLAPRWTVFSPGPDLKLGTDDDEPVKASGLKFSDDGHSASLMFAEPLPPGAYEVELLAGVLTAEGLQTTTDLRWRFEARDERDTDADGMTDGFERLYGFDPADSDENRNGLPDGQDDFDGDGLSNQTELRLGLNPRDAFTFPSVRDDQLDRDRDRLTDGREAELGTDWLKTDTDGDLFTDDAEVLVGTDPVSRRSYPLGVRLTQPTETIHRRLSGAGSPVSAVTAPAINFATVLQRHHTVISQPPVETLHVSTAAGRLPFVFGQPLVEVFAPGRSTNSVPQFFLGQPSIEVSDEQLP